MNTYRTLLSGCYAPSMPASGPPINRGPAAAAENRAALVHWGRVLFADRGFDVPLSAVAKAAGVSQGVLYRHFPSKASLALAVFADNVAEIEQLAGTTDGPDAFVLVWARLVEQCLESVAFIEALSHSKLPDWAGAQRLVACLDGPLAAARTAGLVPDLTTDDLLVVLRMVYGVVATATARETAAIGVARALALVDPRLAVGAR